MPSRCWPYSYAISLIISYIAIAYFYRSAVNGRVLTWQYLASKTKLYATRGEMSKGATHPLRVAPFRRHTTDTNINQADGWSTSWTGKQVVFVVGKKG